MGEDADRVIIRPGDPAWDLTNQPLSAEAEKRIQRVERMGRGRSAAKTIVTAEIDRSPMLEMTAVEAAYQAFNLVSSGSGFVLTLRQMHDLIEIYEKSKPNNVKGDIASFGHVSQMIGVLECRRLAMLHLQELLAQDFDPKSEDGRLAREGGQRTLQRLIQAFVDMHPGVSAQSEADRLRHVANAIRDGRPAVSVRLTRLVDGVSTYTAEVQGLPAREFNDRDEATEWAGDAAALIQAQAVVTALAQNVAYSGGDLKKPESLHGR